MARRNDVIGISKVIKTRAGIETMMTELNFLR